ncbi:MAG: hypothetical protein NTY19_04690 [Planctomycetota bacterium]|nr:hypothetical protein [Planctomycetota bacterium]
MKLTKPHALMAMIVGGCLLPVTTLSAESAKGNSKRAKKIETLIDKLASENDRPQAVRDKTGRRTTVFPSGWSEEKQDAVFRAADELVKMGVRAFPQLIEHFDDDRYSYSHEALNAAPGDRVYYNENVGRHCRKIVREQLHKYEIWGEPLSGFGPTRWGPPGFDNNDAARRWWEQNKDKPLWRLQADALQWAIDVETEYREQKHDERGLDAIRADKELLRRLIETEEAIPTDLRRSRMPDE